MSLALLDYTPIVELQLGPLTISPHGVMTAVGVIVGMVFMLPAAARRGITAELVFDLVTRGLLGAIIGARAAYVLHHLGDYLDDPLEILRFWEGGLSLLGGLAGALVAGYPRLRRSGVSFWSFMDAAVPGIALGIAIGRIGDLVIADHLGKPTASPLGYVCPGSATGSPCAAPVGQAVHQTALYDMVGAGLVLVLLLALGRSHRYPGFLTLVFAASYGGVRFVEGFFRLDVTHGTGLNGSQWVALIVGTTAAAALLTRRSRGSPVELVTPAAEMPVGARGFRGTRS